MARVFWSALVGVLMTSTPLTGQRVGSEVRDLNFEGNANFSDDALRQIILTRATECRSLIFAPFCWVGADFAERSSLYSPLVLPRDAARIRAFYGLRGFRYAQVDTALAYAADSSSVSVTFVINEDEPVLIESLEITGLQDLPEPDRVGLLDGLRTQLGGPLDWLALGEDADTIKARLENRGYAYADVFRGRRVDRAAPYQAEATLDIYAGEPAHIGEVTVQGNVRLAEEVVRRMLPFREGILYRRDDILAAQRNLYSLEIVRSANVEASLENLDAPLVPITVTVTEGDLRRMNWGGGVSTADCLNSEARWTNRNFRGGGRRLLLRASVSNLLAEQFNEFPCYQAGTDEFGVVNWSVGSEFTQPWVFGVRNSLNTNLFVEKQTLKDVFVRRAVGGSASLVRSLGRGAAMSLAYRPEFVELSATDQFFCTSFVVCDPSDIDALARFNWLSPVSLGVTRTRTDQLFNPTRGSTLLLDLEYARNWTGSAFGYNRAIGESAWYRALGRDVIVAGRLRGGVVASRGFSGAGLIEEQAEIVHPQKRFYAGGANSVRGYAQGQLGPRVAVVPVNRLLRDPNDPAATPFCTPDQVVNLTCDTAGLENENVVPRPNGGSGLFVGNLELRLRLHGPALQGVLFVDAGQVWTDYTSASPRDITVTPGFGVRYFSPIGPIRVDVGYRTEGGDLLQVVTEQIRAFDPDTDDESSRLLGQNNEVLPYVSTAQLAILEPRVLFDKSDPWSFQRLQFHISIGQSF